MKDKIINPYSEIIRDTEEYKMVCCQCKDEILVYPRISGRSGYTDDEVDCITLKQIILKSARKDERIVKLEQILSQISEEIEEYREDCIDYEGDDTEGYCYGCQSVYCLAKRIKQIAQGE